MKNNKALFTLFFIVFIDLVGFGIMIPLLPFIAEKYGANPFQIGLLVGIYSFFQLVAAPLLGRLSDRFGRKKVLVISQLGSAAGYFLLAISNNLPLIFLSRIIDGTTGGNISIAQAYIADVTDRTNRAKGMGIIGAAFGMGFIFGPAMGGILARFGYSAPFFFATAIGLITALTTQFFLKETVDISKASRSPRTQLSLKELKGILSLYPIGILILVFFLLNFAFSTMFGNFALWTQKTFDFGPTQNGLLFAYIGALQIVIQLKILPLLIDKYQERKVLNLSIICLAVGLFLLPILIMSPYLLLLSLCIQAFGNGLANPSIQALASENVPKEEYGETLGILQSAGSLGRIFGPIVGGELFFQFGKDTPFFFAAILAVFIFVYLRLSLKKNE